MHFIHTHAWLCLQEEAWNPKVTMHSTRMHVSLMLTVYLLLQEEAAALEAANVYAMLENTPLVDGVITDLRRTQSILDDLDESLKVSGGAYNLE